MELSELIKERPEILVLLKAYTEAEKRNPAGTAQALPIVLKFLTDRKKESTPPAAGPFKDIFSTF
jgi:hypothetical protein